MAFGKPDKPYTEALNGRKQIEGPRDLDRPRPVIPPPQALDYDDEYAPPDRRQRQEPQHERVLLEGLRDALTVPPPLDAAGAIVRSLTYGDMVEFAAHVAASLNRDRDQKVTDTEVASALHEFGKSRK